MIPFLQTRLWRGAHEMSMEHSQHKTFPWFVLALKWKVYSLSVGSVQPFHLIKKKGQQIPHQRCGCPAGWPHKSVGCCGDTAGRRKIQFFLKCLLHQRVRKCPTVSTLEAVLFWKSGKQPTTKPHPKDDAYFHKYSKNWMFFLKYLLKLILPSQQCKFAADSIEVSCTGIYRFALWEMFWKCYLRLCKWNRFRSFSQSSLLSIKALWCQGNSD